VATARCVAPLIQAKVLFYIAFTGYRPIAPDNIAGTQGDPARPYDRI
jgi:hypothetical protein